MNICILTRSTLAHQMGGTQVHCKTLADMAVASGQSVTVITTRHPKGVVRQQEDGYNIYYLAKTRPARLDRDWWINSADMIGQLHKQNKFDVIWAENLAGYYYAWKSRPILKIPIISINQVAGILGHIKSGWNGISSFKEFISFSCKYLPESIFCYIPWFSRALKHSDAIVSISDQTAAALKKEFRLSDDKNFVVYDGIDIDKFKPDQSKRESVRKRFSLSNEDKVILMAGVVHKQKGMHVGLKAFCRIKKEIPNCKMMIIGDGPQLKSLKEMAKESGIEKEVIFCGYVSNKETPLYYNGADVFLNPTLRVEGLAIVIIEAMACGLPSVVSRIGGTQSTIDEGVSGFFVEPKDLDSITAKTIKILNDPVLSRKMGQCARDKALKKFSKENMINSYLDISQQLVA